MRKAPSKALIVTTSLLLACWGYLVWSSDQPPAKQNHVAAEEKVAAQTHVRQAPQQLQPKNDPARYQVANRKIPRKTVHKLLGKGKLVSLGAETYSFVNPKMGAYKVVPDPNSSGYIVLYR